MLRVWVAACGPAVRPDRGGCRPADTRSAPTSHSATPPTAPALPTTESRTQRPLALLPRSSTDAAGIPPQKPHEPSNPESGYTPTGASTTHSVPSMEFDTRARPSPAPPSARAGLTPRATASGTTPPERPPDKHWRLGGS